MKIPGVKEMEHLPLQTALLKHQERELRRRQVFAGIVLGVFLGCALAIII